MSFVPIDKAQSLVMLEGKKNSDIKGIVIKIGDLKSGTSSKGVWTKKDVTLEDESGTQILTAWNDDIEKFKLGTIYEITNPWWSVYDGKPQLQLGKFATVKESTIPNEIELKEIPETTRQETITASNPQEQLNNLTNDEMITRTYDMVKQMYHDYVDTKLSEVNQN